jgi:hypothetical protein
LEGLFFGDIVDNDDPLSSLVVGARNGSEPFLAGSVPNLELDNFSFNDDGSALP